MSSLTDLKIIEKIRDGETALYATLVNRYKYMVYTTALRMIKIKEDAEEVSQDVFVNAYKALESFRGECKVSTWLYRITYHKCLDHLKKNRRRNTENNKDISEYYNIADMDNQMEALEQQDRKRIVKDAIHALPGEDSMLISMFYLQEFSLKEISEITGYSTNSIKVKLFRSRKRLLDILRKKLEPSIIVRYER